MFLDETTFNQLSLKALLTKRNTFIKLIELIQKQFFKNSFLENSICTIILYSIADNVVVVKKVLVGKMNCF